MTLPLHILLVASDADLIDAVQSSLNQQAQITQAAEASNWDQMLAQARCDLVLLAAADDGASVLHQIAPARQYAPVIILAAQGSIPGAVHALQAGAVDYLTAGPELTEQLRVAVQAALNTVSLPEAFDHACHNIPVMMMLVDADGSVQDANIKFLTELGYAHSQVIGQPLKRFMSAASAQALLEHQLPRLWHTGQIIAVPCQYIRRSGAVIEALMSAGLTQDEHGQQRALILAHDITEQKTIEIAEREQRVLAEALRDTTAALNDTLDFEEVLDRILANVARVLPYDTGNIMLIEGRRARMVRNQRSSELGREIRVPTASFEIAQTPTLRHMYETARPLAILDTREFSEWVELPQSAWIRSFVGAPIVDDRQVIGFITLNSSLRGTFTQQHAERLATFAHHASIAIRNARLFDTAQRYASELEHRVARRTAQLNLERNQLRAILEATGEGILYIEGDRISYTNIAFNRLTGYTPDELTQQPVHLLTADQMDTDAYWQNVKDFLAAGAAVWRDEVRLRRKDGSSFDAGLTITHAGETGERVQRLVIVVRDISQQKALDAQKARFIATASHELRTPITNVITRLYLMKHQPERLDEHMQVLSQVTQRMQHLVEDLLDISRFDRGTIVLERTRIDLGQLLEDVTQVQYEEANARDIRLDLRKPDTPLYIEGDQERLAQVITNLINNALMYTHPGGRVTVSLTPTNREAVIRVEDTGIGIAPDKLEDIFEPFVRLNDKIKGTGLGLSIAREIVRLHEGTITVTSEPGAGSCFTVTLKLLPVLA
jgi:PAS domain S-box-containing protein